VYGVLWGVGSVWCTMRACPRSTIQINIYLLSTSSSLQGIELVGFMTYNPFSSGRSITEFNMTRPGRYRDHFLLNELVICGGNKVTGSSPLHINTLGFSICPHATHLKYSFLCFFNILTQTRLVSGPPIYSATCSPALYLTSTGP